MAVVIWGGGQVHRVVNFYSECEGLSRVIWGILWCKFSCWTLARVSWWFDVHDAAVAERRVIHTGSKQRTSLAWIWGLILNLCMLSWCSYLFLFTIKVSGTFHTLTRFEHLLSVPIIAAACKVEPNAWGADLFKKTGTMHVQWQEQKQIHTFTIITMP